jgi:hypothetical protein
MEARPTRERAGPERFLQSYRGYLQADAYVAYDSFFTNPERSDHRARVERRRLDLESECSGNFDFERTGVDKAVGRRRVRNDERYPCIEAGVAAA